MKNNISSYIIDDYLSIYHYYHLVMLNPDYESNDVSNAVHKLFALEMVAKSAGIDIDNEYLKFKELLKKKNESFYVDKLIQEMLKNENNTK